MRTIAIVLFSLITAVFAAAGDLATFVNLGFSADGSRFVFGQYGVTDSDFRSYADIFCVDVGKNDFIPGGKFSSPPAQATMGKDSRGLFAELQNTAAAFLKKQGIDSSLQGRSLYVQAEDEPTLKTVAFRDFETGNSFDVAVHVLTTGTGAGVKSSFYLIVSITGPDGNMQRKTVGLPGFERPGVSDYLIRRIITDGTGKSIVFVIEKKTFDKNGNSIRYMVETLRL